MERLFLAASVLAALQPVAAQAQPGPAGELVALVNAWRAAPATCQGRPRPAVPALAPLPVLSRVALRQGSILLAALDAAGYDPQVADAVQVDGPGDARGAFDVLREAYCATLSSTRYLHIGARRSGNEWTVVLAAPVPNPLDLLPALAQAQQEVLAATNAARATARACGGSWMPAAPPVIWNGALADAALHHSRDMAQQGYFAHADPQGKEVDRRAEDAGYAWRHISENIARGQTSAEEAVASWIGSPNHCRALMNPRYSEMGAAYSIRPGKRPAAYWTQVFGAPR